MKTKISYKFLFPAVEWIFARDFLSIVRLKSNKGRQYDTFFIRG